MTDKVSGLPRPLLYGGAAVLLTLLLTAGVPRQHGGRGVPSAIVFQGLIQGLIAGRPGLRLVLMFRTSRIINFGALAFGIPGGLLAFELIRFTDAPFPVAVFACLVLSAAFGAVAELTLRPPVRQAVSADLHDRHDLHLALPGAGRLARRAERAVPARRRAAPVRR